MASVTFPSTLGGDGLTYTDDSDPSTGLANGGHRTRFVPALSGAVAMAQSAADSATKALRRNVLVNAPFEVWNDSTSSTSCTAGARTAGPECWYVNPAGAAVTRARSTTVRTGNRARYSLELVGATSVTTVLIGTRIEAADIPKLATTVTFQAWVYNGSGSAFTPNLLIGTPGATDDFTTVTNRLTQALQSCANAAWTQVSHSVDISAYTNLANGLQVEVQIPSGSMVSGDTNRIMEPMLCPGSVVTDFDYEPLTDTEQRCERYYVKSFARATAPAQNVGTTTGESAWRQCTSTTGQAGSDQIRFRVQMRATPNITLYNPGAANAEARNITRSQDCSSSAANGISGNGFYIGCNGSAAAAVGDVIGIHWTANARLF